MGINVTDKSESESSSGNATVVVAVIVVVIVVVIIVTLCICCARRRKACFDKPANTHIPLGSSESDHRQFQMIRRDQHGTPGSIRSAYNIHLQ